MNKLTINDLLDKIKEYNEEETTIVKKAYEYAEKYHKGQYRESGEEYITHPLNVAYILASIHADRDTVCAGLLHDALEDTPLTKEEIEKMFNKNVAELVDGVTKIRNMDFYSREEENSANKRKIITSVTDDARIIIIKLADRLHNMRTLKYKKEEKRKSKAMETLEIYVPLAYYLGAAEIKAELEDLSFKYISPDIYKHIYETRNEIVKENETILNEMINEISTLLKENNINNKIRLRIKNTYRIYEKLRKGYKISEIHDLKSLKIILDTKEDCYKALGLIHSKYKAYNEKFKDYISNPKTNMYMSIHSTIFAPDDSLVQTQIKTKDMDKVASFGLTGYWDVNKGETRSVMQKDLRKKFQFYHSLTEIDQVFRDNSEFINQIQNEILGAMIYVYGQKGNIIELPKGSTIIDFAYKVYGDKANNMISSYVNGELEPEGKILNNKDRVRIVTGKINNEGPKKDWEALAQTTIAKRQIREYQTKESRD